MLRPKITLLPLLGLCFAQAQDKPHIIFILADDMGYGDVAAMNSESQLPTPNLDKMCQNGLIFTDAHTSSSVSTPTRYGVVTGRYNWRSTLKKGVLGGFSQALIPQQRSTIAGVLKRAQYTTGVIGKWHLGWDWHKADASHKETGDSRYDLTHEISNGPKDRGFDYSYCFNGSLDMAPYVYVENGKATAPIKNVTQSKDKYGWWRKGLTADDFSHKGCIRHLTDQAIQFIAREKDKEEPFFLYLPYPSPHTPILPSEKWQGKSGINPYGDYVMMMDDEVGRVLNYLEEAGIQENTLVVFTTDNGCSPAAMIEELQEKGHSPNGILRGHKADLFEGGHRVPCIVQWPKGVTKGTCSQTICLTDFFSTFAEIAGVSIADNEGEDSFSLASLLRNPQEEKPLRPATIHHSIIGEFAIRMGDWKLLASASSGGWSAPRPNDTKALEGLPPMQLFNLKSDPSEQKNLYTQEPEKVKEMLLALQDIIDKGRSTAGAPQANDEVKAWPQREQVELLLKEMK